MKTRTILFTTTALLAILLVVPLAYAQHMRGGHRGAGEFGPVMMLGHLDRAKQVLGLSDQQVADIKTIFENLKTQNQPYRDQLKGGMQSIAQTLLSNPNDLAAAQNLLTQQEQAQHAMKLNALTAASKALNVLTPEQRATLAQHLQQRAASRGMNRQ